MARRARLADIQMVARAAQIRSRVPDIGGSDGWSCEAVRGAVRRPTEFKHLSLFYHNCLYEGVWKG
jgi:uncharacterized protein with von Willebrand factor type A (vWA) domain